MSWKVSFSEGISHFQASCFDDALQKFNEAIERGGDQQYVVYDSRAAAYEKLGRPKDALRDAKKVIGLAQDRWQGYARAARLFLQAHKHDASLAMANMALNRLKPTDTKRRLELSKLKDEVLEVQCAEEEHRRSTQHHFGKLPVEIFGEVFRWVVVDEPARLFVIMHVCQHWRSVVWHTSVLWDTLILTHRDPVRKAKLWIGQSNGRIRELRIRAGALTHLDWPFHQLRGLLWNSLRTCKIENWDISRYLESISMSHIIANLEDIAVENVEELMSSHPTKIFNFPEGSQARSVTMVRTLFSWDALSAHLRSLTSLIVRTCVSEGEDCLSTLEANPLLETLILDLAHLPLSDAHAPVHLSSLTHLEIGGLWVPNLLDQIVTPILRTLRIYRAARSLDRALYSAADRGLTCLTELCISRSWLTPAVLIELLRQTPSLESLELLHLSGTVNQVIEALATPLESSNLAKAGVMMCPSLTYLDVSHAPDVKTGPLVRLIKSRIPDSTCDDSGDAPLVPKIARIATLIADGCQQIDADWVPWLRNNVQILSCVYLTKKTAAWKR